MIRPPVFRFAPSPNGYLHLGHAYSALLNFDAARQSSGRFLLRIEDIDTVRCRPEFETAIYQDLAWLGIAWESQVRRQSEHLAGYRDALAKLSAQGLIYPSFESRAEIAEGVAQREADAPWPRDPDGAPLANAPHSGYQRVEIGCGRTGSELGVPQRHVESRVLAAHEARGTNSVFVTERERQQQQRPTFSVIGDNDEGQEVLALSDLPLPGAEEIEPLVWRREL